jgi:hypothetical protein
MRAQTIKPFGLILLLLGTLVYTIPTYSQNSEAPLTNASVIKLVRAGFREKTILTIIRSKPSRFDLSPDKLIELKRGGVSETIILAMLATQEGSVALSDDDWNDPFFNNGKSPSNKGNGAGTGDSSDPNEMSIFGSGSGSKGKSRSYGGTGSNDAETQSSGSATVRIIRPPTEGGKAPAPKLEKTPTLTNESIIDLVEGGFSEGTIIRRIEQSPADFELTPSKIGELQRRHVSDKIIAAMKIAMGEDPSTIKSNTTPTSSQPNLPALPKVEP